MRPDAKVKTQQASGWQTARQRGRLPVGNAEELW